MITPFILVVIVLEVATGQYQGFKIPQTSYTTCYYSAQKVQAVFEERWKTDKSIQLIQLECVSPEAES